MAKHVLAVLAVMASGCVPTRMSAEQLAIITSEETQCPVGSLTTSDREDENTALTYAVPRKWRAVGCEREWWCHHRLAPFYDWRCEETPASKELVTRKVVVDRLALETMCPGERIEIVSQTDWRVGTETAYRLSACGRPYVCTAAAGRINCKAALAE